MNAPVIPSDLLEQLVQAMQGRPLPAPEELASLARDVGLMENERFLVMETLSRLWQATLPIMAAHQITPDEMLMLIAERLGNLPIPEKRRHERTDLAEELRLRFHNGLEVEGVTRDVSLEGVFVETPYEPKWHLVGEQGVFDYPVGGKPHGFAFRVVRVTPTGIGLQLPQDLGLFGFALARNRELVGSHPGP